MQANCVIILVYNNIIIMSNAVRSSRSYAAITRDVCERTVITCQLWRVDGCASVKAKPIKRIYGSCN